MTEQDTGALRRFLDSMKHSPVRNYGIPGLTSWLIGAAGPSGVVRLMDCEREHQEPIIPHSHRFDFHCKVLAGTVTNLIWTPCHFGGGDEYHSSELVYCGQMGKYKTEPSGVTRWNVSRARYETGDEYSMKSDEVHSIFFSRGAVVLFFEGPTVSDRSIILEPFVNGEVVPTFKVEPWMFKRLPMATI